MNSDAPPFPRGQTGTYISDATAGTIDATGGGHLEGMEYDFEDLDFSVQLGAGAQRSGRRVRCRIVRNKSGGLLLPKKAVKPYTAAAAKGDVFSETDGYAALGDPILGIVDEFLPAAGVAANELFWVVTRGPSTCLTDSAGDTNFGVGKVLVPGGGTAGNLVEQDVTVAAGSATFNQLQSAVGRAMEAVNATATAVMVDVGAP